MHEIVCVGDVHEGLSFDFRIDPETGISERALDLHGNFAKAARWAIEHDASLFCILGDLFDRAHVAPVFREMVRRDVIEPLGGAGIEVWILAGNHDQPRRAVRSTSLDDYRGYRHVKVFRDPKMELREIDGRKSGFLAIRPEGGWSFVELPARPMDKVEAVIGMSDDVTEKVLAAIPAQITGHLVRIEVTLPDELRNRLDEKRLADRLRDAFHYEVKFVSTSRPRIVTEEFTLDPGRLLSDYVDKVLADHPKREAIKVEARRLLKE